jgi:hypothetical protein
MPISRGCAIIITGRPKELASGMESSASVLSGCLLPSFIQARHCPPGIILGKPPV